MSRFCPACHRNDSLNPNAITQERTSCPRDFFQIVDIPTTDPSSQNQLIDKVFGGRFKTTVCILPGEKHAIFKVTEVATNSEFIVSILRRKSVDTKRIIKFVDAWQGINHRNILPITESGASPDKEFFYVISENPGGKPLTAVLDEHGTLAPEVAILVFLQLCEGLERISKVNIVHGNLMPAHIYQKTESDLAHHVMISCDTALACFVDPPPDATPSSDESELSPLYLGLEFLRTGDLPDSSTDVYSLGTFMYAVLTGLPPFSGKTFESIKQSHKEEQPLSLRGAAPDIEIPGLFDKIVLRTLKKDKIERYPNAEALKSDLLTAAEKSRIYLPTYANASYVAQPYTGDTGTFQAPTTKPQDFLQGSTTQAPPLSGNTGPVDYGKDLEELPPESRQELEDKVKGLRSHVNAVSLVAVLVIVGLVSIMLYEGPSEDRAPAWKKLSWTMAMSSGDGAMGSKSWQQAKEQFETALKTASEIEDGGDRRTKTMRKLRKVHEELRDKKGAESYREQIIRFDKIRLAQDEVPVK